MGKLYCSLPKKKGGMGGDDGFTLYSGGACVFTEEGVS